MFKEFSDSELVIMWHRLNQGKRFYDNYKEGMTDIARLRVLEIRHKHSLWKKIDAECSYRKIDAFTLTINKPVEVVTYKDKEVDLE